MDGPNVNLKFLDDVAKDFGCEWIKWVNFCWYLWSACNKWSIQDWCRINRLEKKKILKAAFQILHDSPARREDYKSITCYVHSLNFCACDLILGIMQLADSAISFLNLCILVSQRMYKLFYFNLHHFFSFIIYDLWTLYIFTDLLDWFVREVSNHSIFWIHILEL